MRRSTPGIGEEDQARRDACTAARCVKSALMFKLYLLSARRSHLRERHTIVEARRAVS